MNYYWPEEEVRSKLENTIVAAFKSVLDVALTYKVNMRIAAYMNAIKRVSNAMFTRKLKPPVILPSEKT